MPAAQPAFQIDEIGDATCLRILKDLVSPTSLAEIGGALDDLIARSTRVIVDMSRVGFMPTTMLGHFIAAATRLRSKNARLVIVGASPQITEVFIVAKVRDHFDFAPSVEAAASAFPA